MATYAGYQRYEIPDIGGNVAKIMLAQQQAEQQSDAQQKAYDYRMAKLQADKEKEARQSGEKYETLIAQADAKLTGDLEKVPITGFSTADGVLNDLASQLKTSALNNNNELRQTGNRAKFNTVKQAIDAAPVQLKKTYEAITSASKVATESGNPFVGHLVSEGLEIITPSELVKVKPSIAFKDNGEMNIEIESQQTDENGNVVSTSKRPLSSINTLSALSDYKGRDLEKEMTEAARSVGAISKEMKWQGGSRTVTDVKAQQNFNRQKERFYKSVTASPIDLAGAYVQYASSQDSPAIFLNVDSPEWKKQKLAESYGFSIEQAEPYFVKYKIDKKGLPELMLTKEQEKKLQAGIYSSFDDKAIYKESFALPSTTNVTTNVINHEGKNEPTIVEDSMDLTKQEGVNAAIFLLNNAKARGDVYDWEIVKSYPGVPAEMIAKIKASGEDVDMALQRLKRQGFVTNIQGVPTGDIKIRQVVGTHEGDKIPSQNYIILNARKNQKQYRQILGYSADATGFRNQTEGTYPKEKK